MREAGKVLMMGAIYQRAAALGIWLGQGADELEDGEAAEAMCMPRWIG